MEEAERKARDEAAKRAKEEEEATSRAKEEAERKAAGAFCSHFAGVSYHCVMFVCSGSSA